MKPHLIVSQRPFINPGWREVYLNDVNIGFVGTEVDGRPFFVLHSHPVMKMEADVYTTMTHRRIKRSVCVTLKKGRKENK